MRKRDSFGYAVAITLMLLVLWVGALASRNSGATLYHGNGPRFPGQAGGVLYPGMSGTNSPVWIPCNRSRRHPRGHLYTSQQVEMWFIASQHESHAYPDCCTDEHPCKMGYYYDRPPMGFEPSESKPIVVPGSGLQVVHGVDHE